MQWSDISFTPSRRTLRQFAGLWVLFFGGLACWHGLVRGCPGLALVLAASALMVGPAGLIWPAIIRPIYIGWMILVFPIGWAMSRVVMAMLFYGLFTPLGLLFRLLGRDPLGLRPIPNRVTYWASKPAAPSVRNYYRQF